MSLFYRKTKLISLSILATAAYIMMLMSSFAQGWDDFRLGFEEGQSMEWKTFFLDLKPKDGFNSFPDEIVNEISGDKLKFRSDNAQIQIPSKDIKYKYSGLYFTAEIILSLLIFFIVFYIPVQFFKLMRSLIREVVFDKGNIKYLRKTGFALLLFYVSSLAFNMISYFENKLLFDFYGYKIQITETDLIWLLLGIVMLLFSEILSQGSKIKEDQDLTI